MKTHLKAIQLALLLLNVWLVALAAQAATEPRNAVLDWNEYAKQSIVDLGGQGPPLASIESAIVHTAIYDAVNAISGYPFAEYAVTPEVRHPASMDAAVATAAHHTLVAMYPGQKQQLDKTYADYLAAIPDCMAKVNGIAVGEQTAAGILELRADDGRYAGTPWEPPSPGPGVWERTPPGFLPPATPWVREVTPWIIETPSPFRVPPPPDLDTEEWILDYNEVKNYGGAVSSVRTAEQTDLGRFIGGPGDNPYLQWHRVWRRIAIDQQLSVLDASRFFAMLTTAASDAFIACWDSKYHYAFWRPVTAIRAGGGNAQLQPDPNWIGLVVTPNHPEYPAAHGCFSGSAIETLKAYFGTDEFSFTLDSTVPGLMQPVRQYSSFDQALEDILNARIYGGMHYRNSTQVGAELGRQVSHQVVENFFLPQ